MRGGVAYIDTEGTFRPDRILPIAERFGMDPGDVLNNIIYARAYTYEHQYNLLLGLAAKMAQEPFRLLQKLAQMLSRLIKIEEEFNVAVYMTNQVIADPGGGVFISDPNKPAGGHVLAHAATIRLMFTKGKGEQRVCKMPRTEPATNSFCSYDGEVCKYRLKLPPFKYKLVFTNRYLPVLQTSIENVNCQPQDQLCMSAS